MIKESKEELNGLLSEWTETIEDLKFPPSKLEHLKKNKDLYAEVKAKLDGLDDAWAKFQEGLEEANVIINKCYISLKTEVDNSIEDFKKECQDNKRNF